MGAYAESVRGSYRRTPQQHADRILIVAQRIMNKHRWWMRWFALTTLVELSEIRYHATKIYFAEEAKKNELLK